MSRERKVEPAPAGRTLRDKPDTLQSATPNDSSFCSDDDPRTVATPGLEGGGDEALVVADIRLVQAVCVGGIDEGDPGVEHGAEHVEGLCFRRAAVEREMHATVADGRDR